MSEPPMTTLALGLDGGGWTLVRSPLRVQRQALDLAGHGDLQCAPLRALVVRDGTA